MLRTPNFCRFSLGYLFIWTETGIRHSGAFPSRTGDEKYVRNIARSENYCFRANMRRGVREKTGHTIFF